MTTITCLKELNKRKCLELDDIVIFTVKEEKIEYIVKVIHLHSIKERNNEIFRILDLDRDKLAEKMYGYKKDINYVSNYYWPVTSLDDYSALTRLVKELYTIIEEKETKYTKYNRFEIMDI